MICDKSCFFVVDAVRKTEQVGKPALRLLPDRPFGLRAEVVRQKVLINRGVIPSRDQRHPAFGQQRQRINQPRKIDEVIPRTRKLVRPVQSLCQRMVNQATTFGAELAERAFVVLLQRDRLAGWVILPFDIASVGFQSHGFPADQQRTMFAPLHIDARTHSVSPSVG